jgi:uncharacterized protein (TIGR03086 family)
VRMPIKFEQLKVLHGRAVRHSVDLVRGATIPDLSSPTPCAGWTLLDLLVHMTAQHRGFAAAADGRGADLDAWSPRPLGDDAVVRYGEAADDLLAAFAKVDSPDTAFALPEFTMERTFPASLAIGFHFIDYLVHSWDVAATLGVPFHPDAELVDAGLPIAVAVPGGDARLAAGSAFQPERPVEDGAGTFDQILAILGRSPGDYPLTR